MDENGDTTLAMLVLKQYKDLTNILEKNNKRLVTIIIILTAIIGLFVGGLVYIFTHYNFSYKDITVTEYNTNYKDNV